MGRPLEKRILGNASGDIKVEAYLNGGNRTSAYIVKQLGSRRFKVAYVNGGTTYTTIARLVTTTPAADGEMRITLKDSAAATYFATKISGRTAAVVRGTGTQFVSGAKVAWNLSAAVEGESLVINTI